MALGATLIVLGLLALLLIVRAAGRFRRRRVVAGLASGVFAMLLVCLAGCIALVAGNLRSYQRLTVEQPAGEIEFHQTGRQQYDGVLTLPDGTKAAFALRGDEWQVDARLLKWRPLANLVGFDTAYRLERIGGRYTRIDDERSQPHTVFPLNPPDGADLWALIRRFHAWIPGVDALFGGAIFLPMADGARYQILVSQSGLLAKPLNQAARDAVKNWH